MKGKGNGVAVGGADDDDVADGDDMEDGWVVVSLPAWARSIGYGSVGKSGRYVYPEYEHFTSLTDDTPLAGTWPCNCWTEV